LNHYSSWLPTAIMVQMFLASIPLAYVGKWGSAIYWFSGGLLNFSVIFLIKKFG